MTAAGLVSFLMTMMADQVLICPLHSSLETKVQIQSLAGKIKIRYNIFWSLLGHFLYLKSQTLLKIEVNGKILCIEIRRAVMAAKSDDKVRYSLKSEG